MQNHVCNRVPSAGVRFRFFEAVGGRTYGFDVTRILSIVSEFFLNDETVHVNRSIAG